MRPIRRAAVTGLLALWLAPLPALAGSQSSNSSSDCDDGRCRKVESYVVEDRQGRRGWVREERWREGGARGYDYRYGYPRQWRDDRRAAPWGHAPRPGRDDDDDD